ncbi:WD repeat domain phosphoinositide-interacting protein 2 [Lepeophtheirus salmonis]|uniref:WD repeat domain phosphoinositide-interacting protein 2 n=1 Tax=Lepeophtheirus salmonis TaxID=72036 RepID=D3PJU3_LEPSM|nr:WD repeat domain phosphoinositide-interacting protein 2-like [Lepeophtheirus salmonis]ADD38829.1 WD repeat domain phosphoinositide-interacting protein 2 [Lepeophtheirus salmonis]
MDEIKFVNFNQDCTSLAVGGEKGYKLYSLNSLDKLELIYGKVTEDQVMVVERLFSSSLLGLVSLSSPRKLRVCHFKKGTEICNYSYSDTIISVKLNRARLVVCLEESLYIHNIRDMKILHTIRDTPSNPRGLCALSINSDHCYLAYPGSHSAGEVQLFDAFHLQAKLMIPAHDAPLAALTFNSSGNRLATASERGTVIRVFSVSDGSKLAEFRRGVKRCALVHSLSFSQDNRFLALSSNTETIHIFKFEEPSTPEAPIVDNSPVEAGGWMGYLTKAVSASASYLPTQVTDTLNQSRAFATVTLPTTSSGGQNTVAIANVSRMPRLLLASSDGYLYIYNIPSSDGEECVMVKQHRIDVDCSSDVNSTYLDNLDNIETEATLSTSPSKSSPIKVPTNRLPGIAVQSSKSPRPCSLENISSCENEPAVLAVTQQESQSMFDESPPPAIHRPDL